MSRYDRHLRHTRHARRALRLGALVLLLASVLLPDHLLAVLTLALSLLSEKAQRYLRLL